MLQLLVCSTAGFFLLSSFLSSLFFFSPHSSVGLPSIAVILHTLGFTHTILSTKKMFFLHGFCIFCNIFQYHDESKIRKKNWEE